MDQASRRPTMTAGMVHAQDASCSLPAQEARDAEHEAAEREQQECRGHAPESMPERHCR